MNDNVICVLLVEKNYEYEAIKEAYTSLDIPSAIMKAARKTIHQDEEDGKIQIYSEYYEVDDFYEVIYFNIAENHQDKVKYKVHYVTVCK